MIITNIANFLKPVSDSFIIENLNIKNSIRCMKILQIKMPCVKLLIDKYNIKRNFPDMRDFRLGPHMIDNIPLDWIIMFTKENKDTHLAGHGMMTRIHWDQDPKHIPDGWQGSVRQSYKNSINKDAKLNTLVGLFIYVENAQRKKGWSGRILNEMLYHGKRLKLSSLIIPLRLPQRYEKEYAEMPFEEFAFLKRADGQYKDHWLRVHTRLGAEILGICNTSHRHAIPLRDFYHIFKVKQFTKNGYQLFSMSDLWYNIYVDTEREYVLIDQACVWVKHRLN